MSDLDFDKQNNLKISIMAHKKSTGAFQVSRSVIDILNTNITSLPECNHLKLTGNICADNHIHFVRRSIIAELVNPENLVQENFQDKITTTLQYSVN